MRGQPRAGALGHLRAGLTGLRAPIVVILLLIAFFSTISGKPLDGAFMLLVGLSLAWDTGHRARQRTSDREGAPGGVEEDDGEPAEPASQSGGDADGPARPGGAMIMGLSAASLTGDVDRPTLAAPDDPAAAANRHRILVLMGVAAAVGYAALTAMFTRYSWPATVPIVALDVAVIILGWHGPRRARPVPGRLPRAGLLAWATVFVAGCLWELTALLEQPTLTTSSYTHPTISTLTDPLLSTSPGRAVVLLAWLGLGWFLVER
jgi:hypothetical protein